jgi:hypothetical protein
MKHALVNPSDGLTEAATVRLSSIRRALPAEFTPVP